MLVKRLIIIEKGGTRHELQQAGSHGSWRRSSRNPGLEDPLADRSWQ